MTEAAGGGPARRSIRDRSGWGRRFLLIGFIAYLGAVGYSTIGPEPSEELGSVATRTRDAARRVEEAVTRPAASSEGGGWSIDDWLTDLDAEETGNLVMFVPFGVLVPLVWPRRHGWTVPAGVGLSVLIELTQLTVATHRSPEWVDIWWNGWGVVAGYGVWVVGRLVWRRVATA